MHHEQRQRAHDLLRQHNLNRALFAHPETITWLTGFAPFVELGQSPFIAGPSLVWYDSGHFTLIVLDSQADLARDFAADPDATLLTYDGYTIVQPIRAVASMTGILHDLLAASKGSGSVGLEQDMLTARQLHALQTALNTPAITPIDGWLKPLRMVKTAEELVKIRRSFELADIGYPVVREAVRPGAREIDVWAALDSAIQQAAGQRIPLGNDCVVSTRANNIGGLPLHNHIHPGDSLIVDISTIHQGYWSDGCRTFYATDPTPDQIQRHRFIQDALDYAISLVKPGVKTNNIDAQVRAFIERGGYPVYPHHTGHGIGVSGHEEPRIVPYNEVILEAGMVILLEPGTYIPGQAACRLEDGLLVTADGAERLSNTSRNLE